MLNIERYKNKLGTKTTELEFEIQLLMGNNPSCDKKSCHICRKENIEWLLSEYKEPILTEEEKAYLSEVIKPFRDEVTGILKGDNGSEFIRISVENDGAFRLPYFKKGSMYKNMKTNKKYKLEELGL